MKKAKKKKKYAYFERLSSKMLASLKQFHDSDFNFKLKEEIKKLYELRSSVN